MRESGNHAPPGRSSGYPARGERPGNSDKRNRQPIKNEPARSREISYGEVRETTKKAAGKGRPEPQSRGVPSYSRPNNPPERRTPSYGAQRKNPPERRKTDSSYASSPSERIPPSDFRQSQSRAAPTAPKRKNPPEKAQMRTKRKKRRGNYILIYLMILFMVLGAGATLSLTVLFRIEKVEVKGESRYGEEQIMEAAEVPLGGNLIRYKQEEAEQGIRESLPYIETVKVRKVLPGTVELTVEAAVAEFVFDHGGRYLLVSGSGRALEYTENRPENLIMVTGAKILEPVPGQALPYERENQPELLKALINEIKGQEFTGIEAIEIGDSTELALRYENRITLLLGTSNDLSYKISFAKKLLEGEI
ncbi:MAG TPA: hypothetical protein DEQ02_09290, partial [Ruminococcaceae bacterium]|nr:hypothetical protein [Oscillospiraceae bacterium]